MRSDNGAQWLGRRALLAAGAGALLTPRAGFAQTPDAPGRKLSEIIADFVVGFDFAKAPPLLVERTRVAFVDTIGVMLGGAHEEVAELARQMIEAEGSAPRATVAGSSLRASAQHAALANGVAAHAMDYDFSYASGQSVSPVIPALLPLAEVVGATPAETMAAFIVGAEVAARLVYASPTISALGGWHAVGMVGPIAATAACARLLKLPRAAIIDAVGISASLASGLSANFGTMTKPLHSGHAARNAVMAAQLGAKGFSSSDSALEARSGYFDTFSRGLQRVEGAFDNLGVTFDLVERGYKLKRYPCGGLSHAAIDATLALRARLGTRAGEIAKIEAGVTKNAFQRIGSRYPNSVEAAKFSMPYIGAWTVLYGAPALKSFTMESIGDPRVKALSMKISHHVDAEFGDELDESPGRVRATLANGESFEEKVWFASGTTQSPMSPAQIEAKFFDCARLVFDEAQARKVFAFVSDLA